MQCEIYLLRHADAVDSGTWTGVDADRPLSSRGQADARRVAGFVRGIALAADVVLSSPKRRARETAAVVADALRVRVAIDERLGGGFGLADLGAIVSRREMRRVVLVGHEPDLSTLLSALIGGGRVAMRPGSLARVDIDDSAPPGAGTLRWLVTPEMLSGTEPAS
jgi:phosphohistidine phosphatase